MSKKELKKKINKMNKELWELIQANDYHLQKTDIINYSKQLDLLIVAYMQDTYQLSYD